MELSDNNYKVRILFAEISSFSSRLNEDKAGVIMVMSLQ